MPHFSPSVHARARSRNLLIDVITSEVVSAFSWSGVSCILLKGPATARWLYRNDVRVYADVDLLVPPSQKNLAFKVLDELDFHAPARDIRNDRPKEAKSWIRRRDGAVVDLHTRLWGVGVEPDELWKELSLDVENMRVGGIEVKVLSQAARALHLALHAAKHGVATHQPKRDLTRAIETLPFGLWVKAAELAQKLQATEGLSSGLRLVGSGVTLANLLGVSEPRSVDVVLAATSTSPHGASIEWLTSLPAHQRVGLIVRKVFPSRQYLGEWSPLAQRGLAGLLLAYIWRPFWLILRLAPSFIEWRATRKHLSTQ